MPDTVALPSPILTGFPNIRGLIDDNSRGQRHRPVKERDQPYRGGGMLTRGKRGNGVCGRGVDRVGGRQRATALAGGGLSRADRVRVQATSGLKEGFLLACVRRISAKLGGMTGDDGFLELDRVGKRYEAGDGAGLAVLNGISLRVGRGESVAVVGPSGSGKTTLLNLMGALDRPDSGSVRLGGEDLSRLDDAGLARVRNESIGFVFQSHHLLPHLNVMENVLLPTLPCADSDVRSKAPERARHLLRRVGLEERLTHRPGQLSGGERQRVAVVRALINGPKLLLADEPTGALDQRSARELGHLLRELNREEGVTLVVVTHSLELAGEMGRVLRMVEGRLEAAAS